MPSDSEVCPPTPDGDADGFSFASDPKLLAEGWKRRHVVDPARARESIELYTAMGFEVKAQQLTPADFGAACAQCASIVCRSYVLIYTRSKSA